MMLLGCRRLLSGILLLSIFFAPPLATGAELPSPEAYVVVRDGHLFRYGERLRLWGINIQGPNLKGHSSYAKIDANIQRIQSMGFNAVRLWGGKALAEWKDGTRIYHTYTKGDGSPLDLMDYTVARLKEKDFIIWLTWFNHRTLIPGDADLVSDPATRTRWQEAVRELQNPKYKLGRGLVFYFNARAKAAFREHITRVLNHRNQWTGVAIKDEPAIGIYELDNELQFIDNMLGIKGKTGWGHASIEEILPPFFAMELKQQWNEYLRKKYRTGKGLQVAWGRLEPGENLEGAAVSLQPTYATARNYPQARGADVLNFYHQLYVDTCRELVRHIRSSGTGRRGSAVVPIISHTIASVHGLHIAYSNSPADAIAYGNYWMQYADKGRLQKKPPLHYPWYSFVERGPGWGFIHPYRQAGKPLLLYEINDYRSDKFRAEFPLLQAITGSWSGLDGIFFYQWDYGFTGDEQQLVNDRLYYSTTDHGWHGVTLYSDEVFLAQMRTASRIFLQGLVKPPPQPTTVRYGKADLDNLRQHWYGPLHGIFPTALHYGLQIAFDPQAEETRVEGPTVKAKEWDGREWRVGKELVWSVDEAFVNLDLPTVKAAAGFLPRELAFQHDVKVRAVQKLWPDADDKMPNQAEGRSADKPYYCFTLVSDDGLPLIKSRRILVSLVSTSQNLGFAFDPSRVPHTGSDAQKMARGIVNAGKVPVQVNRVGAKISAPFLRGKRYRKLDFKLRTFEEGSVKNEFSISPNEPLFIAIIE